VQLIWLGPKTYLIEIVNAVYECGFIGSQNGPILKKELVQYISNIFNIGLSSYQIALNKAMTRESSESVIDILKSKETEYYEKLINKIKG
jgi:hypothetical protein